VADKKISDLTAATSVASGDLFLIENAGGNSRKVAASDAAASLVGWSLVGAGQTATGVYDFAVDGAKADIDFTGLGSFNELLIIGRGLSAANSGRRALRVSTDNGSTFYSASGDYKAIDANGAETDQTVLGLHDTNTTSATSLVCQIINMKGTAKFASSNSATGANRLFVASASDINAIRITNTAAGNITAGTVRVYGR
jgi:hypothetical protein